MEYGLPRKQELAIATAPVPARHKPRQNHLYSIAEETEWRDWASQDPLVPECAHRKGSLALRVESSYVVALAGIYDPKGREARPALGLALACQSKACIWASVHREVH